MTTGAYISGAAHLALLAVLLFGGIFARDRLPEVVVADVSVISEAEFAALTRPDPSPEVADAPPSPMAPEADLSQPETPEADTRPELSQPDAAAPPDAPEDVPETPSLEVPEAEVTTEAPVLAPPTFSDGDEVTPEAAPAPAPRVAPDPVAPPPPEAETAPDVAEATAPEPDAEAEVPIEETPPAAPEAATTEIVTEAEETPDAAPLESIRPRSRPPRPVRVAEEPAAEAATDDAVAAALAETPARPAAATSGPPMSFGEREALRVAVGNCWSVDVGSQSANVTVTVAVSMNRDGTVANGVVRQVSAEGGDAAAQRAAFERARRAILRCQRGGFPLPAEKYDHWREIEMVFNPEGMRLR